MNIEDPTERTCALAAMADVCAAVITTARDEMKSLLTEGERELYEWIDELAFPPGAWYRPIHNIYVPLAMLAIVQREGRDRRLFMPAAILHDCGYAMVDLRRDDVSHRPDIRKEHMAVGADVASVVLAQTRAEHYTESEREAIARLIKTHDNPYLGVPLTTNNERIHRDADRVFVLSTPNWHKEFFRRYGNVASLTPDAFMAEMLANFFPSPEENPLETRYQLDTSLVPYLEGGCEPFSTQTGDAIGSWMFLQRAREYEEHTYDKDVDVFASHINREVRTDLAHLFWHARG